MMQAMYELFTTNEYVKGRMEEMNLVYVNSFSLSPGILACRGKGIRTVADIAGTKVAHTGASGEIFAALGGNMENPVIMALARSLDRAGFATIRFNFRGVGDSQGTFSQGMEAAQDVSAALNLFRDWRGIDARRQVKPRVSCPELRDPGRLIRHLGVPT